MDSAGSPKGIRKLSAHQRRERLVEFARQFLAKNPGASKDDLFAAWVDEIASDSIPKNSKINRDSFVDVTRGLILESDRGCVLVAAAIIDNELEILLREHFASQCPDSEKDADFFFTEGQIPPLRSTALKIRMAFVLGLIDAPLKTALLKIQSLRSRVAAHTRTRMVLKAEQVIKIFECFPSAKRVAAGEIAPTSGPGKPFRILDNPKGDHDAFGPKVMFGSIVACVLEDLEAARRKIKRRRRHSPGSSK